MVDPQIFSAAAAHLGDCLLPEAARLEDAGEGPGGGRPRDAGDWADCVPLLGPDQVARDRHRLLAQARLPGGGLAAAQLALQILSRYYRNCVDIV